MKWLEFYFSAAFFYAVLFAAQQSIHLSDSGLAALIDSFVSRLQSGIVSRKFTAAASAASTGGSRLPVAACRLPLRVAGCRAAKVFYYLPAYQSVIMCAHVSCTYL